MVQVEIKTEYSQALLESKINRFLENKIESVASFKLIDIKFNSNYDNKLMRMTYSAMIIYEV